MTSSLLHLVGLRPRVYYTLTNFRGGARPPCPPLNTPMTILAGPSMGARRNFCRGRGESKKAPHKDKKIPPHGKKCSKKGLKAPYIEKNAYSKINKCHIIWLFQQKCILRTVRRKEPHSKKILLIKLSQNMIINFNIILFLHSTVLHEA